MLETRKTVPGLRVLDKWAVLIGGGRNHRLGLWDMVMIKDNHIAAAGGIPAAVQRTQVRLLPLQQRQLATNQLQHTRSARLDSAHCLVDALTSCCLLFTPASQSFPKRMSRNAVSQ